MLCGVEPGKSGANDDESFHSAIVRETRDARRETRDARRETRDARRETRDARRETRDARRETRDARRETRDASKSIDTAIWVSSLFRSIQSILHRHPDEDRDPSSLFNGSVFQRNDDRLLSHHASRA